MSPTNRIVIFLVVIFFISGFLIPSKFFVDPVRGGIQNGLSPITNFTSYIAKKTIIFFNQVYDFKQILEENQRLSEENAKLIVENIELLEYRFENQTLRKHLGFQVSHPELVTIPARIIAKDPNSFLQIFTVDVGKEAGVKEGNPVILSEFLIGRIEKVYRSSSTVFLITNRESVVNALISESRAFGIVRGELGYGLVMESIPQDAKVQISDMVISSGLSSRIPKGMVIGEVNKVISDESDIFKEVTLTPLIDFSKLELVFIVIK